MIQAKILEMILKQILKHPSIKALFKYKDEPNDCDIKVMELFDYKDKPNELDMAVDQLQKYRNEDKVKLNAALDLFKSSTEKIGNIADKVKQIDKVIDKFDDKLQQIGKIAHPPAIPLKDINELKESAKNVTWMMGIFNSMKKMPLLKSIFK